MAFGLKIESEFDLPELPQVNIGEDQVEIIIKKTDLSSLWSEQGDSNKYFVIKENWILFRIPDIAIYLIKNGREIFVTPFEGSNENQIRLYLLGTCMGALLMQRKILPLHGSAIAINGKAYAIVGDSGAGKSTLASAFLKKGYQLLSDDVIPVTLSDENIPIVTPAYPQQKLWLESLNHFNMEPTHYEPIFERETKFAVPVSNQFAMEPLPLAGIFELIKTEDEKINLQPIKKLERFSTLFQHTYRNFFLAQSGLVEWHFRTSAKILNEIELYQLTRPISRFTAHDLTSFIVMTLKKGAKENDKKSEN